MRFYEFEKAFGEGLNGLFSMSKDLYASINNEDAPLDCTIDNGDAIKTLTSFNSYLNNIYAILYDVHILFSAPENMCETDEEKSIKYVPTITSLFFDIDGNLKSIESEVDYIFECIFGSINAGTTKDYETKSYFDDMSSYLVEYIRDIMDKLSCCLEYFMMSDINSEPERKN